MSRSATSILFLLCILCPTPCPGQDTQESHVPWDFCNGNARDDDRAFCLGAVDNVLSIKQEGCFNDHSCDLFMVARQDFGAIPNSYTFEVFANVTERSLKEVAIEKVSWMKMMFTKEKMDTLFDDPLYIPIAAGLLPDARRTPVLEVYVRTAGNKKIKLPGREVSPGEMTEMFRTEQEHSNNYVTYTQGKYKSHQRFVFRSNQVLNTDFRKVAGDNHAPYHIDWEKDAVYPYVIQYEETLIKKVMLNRDGFPVSVYSKKPGSISVVANILRLKNPVYLFGQVLGEEDIEEEAPPAKHPDDPWTHIVQPKPSTSPRPPKKKPTPPKTRPPKPKPSPTTTTKKPPQTTKSATPKPVTETPTPETTTTVEPTGEPEEEEKEGLPLVIILAVVVVVFLLLVGITGYFLHKRRMSNSRPARRPSLTRRGPTRSPSGSDLRSEIDTTGPASWVFNPHDQRSSIQVPSFTPTPAPAGVSTFKPKAATPVKKAKSIGKRSASTSPESSKGSMGKNKK